MVRHLGNPSPTIYLARPSSTNNKLSNEVGNVGEALTMFIKIKARDTSILFWANSALPIISIRTHTVMIPLTVLNWSPWAMVVGIIRPTCAATWGSYWIWQPQLFQFRIGSVMVPTEANGNVMDKNIQIKPTAAWLNWETVSNQSQTGHHSPVIILHKTHMGSYVQTIQQNPGIARHYRYQKVWPH